MNQNSKKSVMLYDGDCGFCQHWIEKWEKVTKDKVDYIPYRQALPHYPQLTAEDCKKAVQLITPDHKIYSGAHAVFHALALASRPRLLWLYEHLPFFNRLAEAIYQWIAHHRSFLSSFSKQAPTCKK